MAHARTPCFPWDAPHTPAGACNAAAESAQHTQHASRRPAGRFRNRIQQPAALLRHLLPAGGTSPATPAPGDSGPHRSGHAAAALSAAAGGTSAPQGDPSTAGRGWVLATTREMEAAALTPLRGSHQAMRPSGGVGIAVAAGQAGGGVQDGGAPSPAPRCAVHALVRIKARGACEEGAVIWSGQQDHSARAGDVAVADSAAGTASAPAPHQPGAGGGGGGSGAQAHGAQAGAGRGVALGVVTTALPRGAAGYPGGLAVCDAAVLRRLRSGQEGPCGGGGTAGVVQALLVNPGSGGGGRRAGQGAGGGVARACTVEVLWAPDGGA